MCLLWAPRSCPAVEVVWALCAGHGATIHAATVKDGSLVGMGAILLDGVTVRCSCTKARVLCPGSPIACSHTVRRRSRVGRSWRRARWCRLVAQCPAGRVWAGAPAKRLRALEPEEAGFLAQAASDYAALAAVHAAENAKSLEEILARPMVFLQNLLYCLLAKAIKLQGVYPSCMWLVADMPPMRSLQPVAILL